MANRSLVIFLLSLLCGCLHIDSATLEYDRTPLMDVTDYQCYTEGDVAGMVFSTFLLTLSSCLLIGAAVLYRGYVLPMERLREVLENENEQVLDIDGNEDEVAEMLVVRIPPNYFGE